MIRVLRSKIIKTRTNHFCFGCLGEIEKGSHVLREVVTSDHEIYALHFCQECTEYKTICDNSCRECYQLESAFEGYIKKCKENSNV